MMTDTEPQAKAQELMTQLNEMWSGKLVIQDDSSCVLAREQLMQIKGIQKQIEATRTAITKPINDALARVNDLFRPAKDRALELEQSLKSAIVKYSEIVERRKAEDLARLEKEKQAEFMRLTEEAKKAESNGQWFAADDLMTKATLVETAKPVSAVVAPTVAGQAMKTVWKFKIVDEKLIPREYLSVNETAIRQVVTALKDKTSIPGIEIYSEKSISSRSF